MFFTGIQKVVDSSIFEDILGDRFSTGSFQKNNSESFFFDI